MRPAYGDSDSDSDFDFDFESNSRAKELHTHANSCAQVYVCVLYSLGAWWMLLQAKGIYGHITVQQQQQQQQRVGKIVDYK